MRSGGAARLIDGEFDMPPMFVVAERRMAGQAVDRWRAGGGSVVDGFATNSLIVFDPRGRAQLAGVGDRVGAVFGSSPGPCTSGRTTR